MPLTLEPNATYEYILETDRKKPENERPAFICRLLPGCEWRKLAKLTDAHDEAKSVAEKLDTCYAAIEMGLVDWKNMVTTDGAPIPFDGKKADEILTMAESLDLMQAILDQNKTELDKKKSELQSDSNTGQSVMDAQDKPNAKTNPA